MFKEIGITKIKVIKFKIIKREGRDYKLRVGYLDKDKNFSKTGEWIDEPIIEEMFDKDELMMIKSEKHKKYKFEYKNDVLDSLLINIRETRKKEFEDYTIIENYSDIEGMEFLAYTYRNQADKELYVSKLIYNDKEIIADWTSHEWSLIILIDRIRRYFDYDNPYNKN